MCRSNTTIGRLRAPRHPEPSPEPSPKGENVETTENAETTTENVETTTENVEASQNLEASEKVEAKRTSRVLYG